MTRVKRQVLTATVARVGLLINALIAQQSVAVQETMRVQSFVIPLIELRAVRGHVYHVGCACYGINYNACLKIIRNLKSKTIFSSCLYDTEKVLFIDGSM